LALLNDLIKSQRESVEKTVEAARSAMEAQTKAQQSGSVRVAIVHKADPVPVDIALDGEQPERYTGTVWSKRQVAPGHHEVTLTTVGTSPHTLRDIADVAPGGVARLEIKLG
jgi:hypothetical protein